MLLRMCKDCRCCGSLHRLLLLYPAGGDSGVSSIDSSKLPLDASCKPVYPHQYVQVNNIFEVRQGKALVILPGYTNVSDLHYHCLLPLVASSSEEGKLPPVQYDGTAHDSMGQACCPLGLPRAFPQLTTFKRDTITRITAALLAS
jgi:hypothetical protein